MSRQYFHYQELEEFKEGMWRIVRGDERKQNALRSAELMRNVSEFERAMFLAVSKWPNSCAHNLTCEAANRIAWLGHAGCLLGCGSPEENTRAGWHMLSKSEQDAANEAANRVLEYWLSVNDQDTQLKLFGAAEC